MKTHIIIKTTITKSLLFAVLTGIVITLAVAGCSDDETEKKTTAKVVHNPFDHSHEVEVTDVQKHKFEHDFSAQCVARELKNSTNKENDEKRISESCMCIAKYMMKDLTAQEAEKFMTEHENPQSLRIKFESAGYHCLQEKVPPRGPDFSRKQ